jgi:two-component system chemotaxis sensor kinase CheA
VVQYRDEILPLVQVSKVLAGESRRARNGHAPRRKAAPAAGADENIQVVVHASQDQPVGLVVGRVIDIVEEDITARTRAGRAGVLFAAVIQGRVTEFLDVAGILRRANLAAGGAPQPVAVEA